MYQFPLPMIKLTMLMLHQHCREITKISNPKLQEPIHKLHHALIDDLLMIWGALAINAGGKAKQTAAMTIEQYLAEVGEQSIVKLWEDSFDMVKAGDVESMVKWMDDKSINHLIEASFRRPTDNERN